MNKDLPPWPDAERIPEHLVRDVFKPPPAVPVRFGRSALVIGSRGSGKTLLFRYLKQIHPGFVTHIYLSTEFDSLTKAGYGLLAQRYTDDGERQLSGKATTLIALAISDRFLRKALPVPRESLLTCLPEHFRKGVPKIDIQWINHMRALINREPLISFDETAKMLPLVSFVTDAAESNRGVCGTSLFLFDRADVVPPPALLPVFELLDQSGPYTALVATRPGIGGISLARKCSVVVPGDFYDVEYLGLHPRSQAWMDLVNEALEAQFGQKYLSLPIDVRNCITVLSRDSIKVAIQLTSAYMDERCQDGVRTLLPLLEDIQDGYLTAAQRTLQAYVQDFKRTVKKIRDEVIKVQGVLTPGVVVNIRERVQPTLFSQTTSLDLLIDAALRSGAFCMIEGQRWIPGLRPRQVEVPPMLIWTRKYPLWTKTDELAEVSITASDLASQGGRKGVSPAIFIAYRMKFDKSRKFRDDVESRVNTYPGLELVSFLDGNVLPGQKWPSTIRNRIKAAVLAVGDVEGLRPDILFELGFAYGLGKMFIPAFENRPSMEDVPIWLKGRQMGAYGEEGGLGAIIAAIARQLSDPDFEKPATPPQPIPSLAVWLRSLDWNRHSQDQLHTLSSREGLDLVVYNDADLTNERNIRRAASASLLVVSLDSTLLDALMHYVVGAVISKPYAGRGQKQLLRRVVVLEQEPRAFAALSLQKCEDDEDVVVLSKPDQILEVSSTFFRSYKKWLQGTKGN